MVRIHFIFILLITAVFIASAELEDAPISDVEGGVAITGLGKFQLITSDTLEIVLKHPEKCEGTVKLCYAATGMAQPMLANYKNTDALCGTQYCLISMDREPICFGGSCRFVGSELHFKFAEQHEYNCPREVAIDTKIQGFTAVQIPNGCDIIFKGAQMIVDEEAKKAKEEEERKAAAAAATTKYVIIGVACGVAILLIIILIIVAVWCIRKRRRQAASQTPVTATKDKKKSKKSKKQTKVPVPPSGEPTVSTATQSTMVESTQQLSAAPAPTPKEVKAEEKPAEKASPTPSKIEGTVTTTTQDEPPSPAPPASKENSKKSEVKSNKSKEKLPDPKIEGSTAEKPPVLYPLQLREFLEDAFDSLHRMGVFVLQPMKATGPTGGLHPFMFKVKKDFDLNIARKVHQTEIILITSPGAGKMFLLLNKMMKGARNELSRHGMKFTKDHRAEYPVLDEEMLTYLKSPNTNSFIVLYVFTLIYSPDFKDIADDTLDRLSMGALFVVAMMIQLPPYVRMGALTLWRYRMPHIQRLFSEAELFAMPYPANLLPKLSPRKTAKLQTIPADVAIVEDKYFDQVIATYVPPNPVKTPMSKSKSRKRRRALKSNNQISSKSKEKNRKSPDKTSKSTESKSGERNSKSGESQHKSIESENQKKTESKKSPSVKKKQKNDEKPDKSAKKTSKSMSKESKTNESVDN